MHAGLKSTCLLETIRWAAQPVRSSDGNEMFNLVRLAVRLCAYVVRSTHTSPREKTSKAMRNQRLCVHGFQLAKLVWPPVVLRDANRFMTGAE